MANVIQCQPIVLTATIKALTHIVENHNKIIYPASLGSESIVLIDIIYKNFKNKIEIFTIDTGRLPEQTTQLIKTINHNYGNLIEVVTPDENVLVDYISKNGNNAFYESVEKRKQCCGVRKINPFVNRIKGYDAWITGVRKQQSSNREKFEFKMEDRANNSYRYSPMLDWTDTSIWKYIEQYNLPYNKLYDKGYTSIGCDPCTRAIKSGESHRAGRWFWENSTSKECGIQNL